MTEAKTHDDVVTRNEELVFDRVSILIGGGVLLFIFGSGAPSILDAEQFSAIALGPAVAGLLMLLFAGYFALETSHLAAMAIGAGLLGMLGTAGLASLDSESGQGERLLALGSLSCGIALGIFAVVVVLRSPRTRARLAPGFVTAATLVAAAAAIVAVARA